MSTTKQKMAAKENLKKARASGTKRKKDAASSKGNALSTAEKDDLPRKAFAFPDERKEPLTDATHVRNAIARFDQVEGVSDKERDAAWKRIRKAAKKFGVDIEVKGWRALMKGGKAGRTSKGSSAKSSKGSKSASSKGSKGAKKGSKSSKGSKGSKKG